MSELTLDEAIKHCLEVAEQNDVQADKIGRQFIGSAMDKRATDCCECAADHIAQKKLIAEYKRLLKLAIDDLNFESQCRNCKHKEYGLNTVCKECRGNKYKWRYADEVLALIGEGGENDA